MLTPILIVSACFALALAGVLMLLAHMRRLERRKRRKIRRQNNDRTWWAMLWERRFAPARHKALTYEPHRDADIREG